MKEKKTTKSDTAKKRGRKPKVAKVDTTELVNELPPVEEVMLAAEQYAAEPFIEDDDDDDTLEELASIAKREDMSVETKTPQEPEADVQDAQDSSPVEKVVEFEMHDMTKRQKKQKPAVHDDSLEHEVKNNVSEKDTNDMLNYLHMQQIPKIVNNDVWVRAVAKVLKRDTSVSWCVLKRITHKEVVVEKIFGSCSPIVKTGTPIPIDTVPPSVIAKFEDGDIDSRRSFILANFSVNREKVFNMNERQLDIEIMKLQIKRYGETKYRG